MEPASHGEAVGERISGEDREREMMPVKNQSANPFLDLTWMDIQEWAGSKILSRGKSYQRSGSVSGLGITKKNELVAWVEGSTRYATSVKFKRNTLSSTCTCPYGINCKHGVAVVIKYLEALKQKRDVPVISAADKRISLIKEGKTKYPDDLEVDWEEEYDDDFEGRQPSRLVKKGRQSGGSLDDFLKSKSHDELIELVKGIAGSNHEAGAELSFKARLSSPSVTALVKTIGKEIDIVTRESGWSDHWNHSGYTPDYSRVVAGLQKLFDAGKFDKVVLLGKKLYAKGMEQAGQSNDEGETIGEISSALSVVFRALQKCSLPEVDKMELAIDWEINDEYSMADGLEAFWKKKFKKDDWSIVADRLFRRLNNCKPEDRKSEFSRDYHRDALTNQIINALENAGRSKEKLALCIREAPMTQSYDRLVAILRKSGKLTEAEEWIRKGINATRDNLPGIASGLRKQLFEIHSQKRDWSFCAAIKADEFLEYPSLSSYKELKQACGKAGIWEATRPDIITFLNNGARPIAGNAPWPLPETGIASSSSRGYSKPPFTTELIEIALFEKNIEEALRLYDEDERKKGNLSSPGFGWGDSISDRIADTVKNKYPERSIGIWKKAAEGHINRTSPKEYTIALGYLNRMLKVMKSIGKEKEFRNYIAEIREQNKRKIRLVQMLDGMSGKRIIDE